MNLMTSSRNCTCQQSAVNCLDQHNISVEQDALHNCWAYDALQCMSEIVCYRSAEGVCRLLAVRESEPCLGTQQLVSLGLSCLTYCHSSLAEPETGQDMYSCTDLPVVYRTERESDYNALASQQV